MSASSATARRPSVSGKLCGRHGRHAICSSLVLCCVCVCARIIALWNIYAYSNRAAKFLARTHATRRVGDVYDVRVRVRVSHTRTPRSLIVVCARDALSPTLFVRQHARMPVPFWAIILAFSECDDIRTYSLSMSYNTSCRTCVLLVLCTVHVDRVTGTRAVVAAVVVARLVAADAC